MVSFVEALTTPYALDGFFILLLIRSIFRRGSDKKMGKLKLSSNDILKFSLIKVSPKKIGGKSILLHELGRVSLVRRELTI